MLKPNMVAHLARPLRFIDWRVTTIEKWIDTPLNGDDEKYVRIACRESGGLKLGSFYHWYLIKKLVSDAVHGTKRTDFLRFMTRADHSNYSVLHSQADSSRGLLIAVPHHAHYILSIVMLAERLRFTRPVYLFYGRPETHPGNEVFDRLNGWFWGEGSNVGFLHDTPKGLANTLRALRSGAAVFIMPDAFKDEEQTLAIPFCGRPLNVMLGTSVLSRKSGASILPMISTPHGGGIGFRSEFGKLMHADRTQRDSLASQTYDYAVMREIFQFYEPFMAKQMMYWQNVRKFVSNTRPFACLSAPEVERVAQLLHVDPEIQAPAQVIDL